MSTYQQEAPGYIFAALSASIAGTGTTLGSHALCLVLVGSFFLFMAVIGHIKHSTTNTPFFFRIRAASTSQAVATTDAEMEGTSGRSSI